MARDPRASHQSLVPLERIRFEIGIPHRVELRPVCHRHDRAVVRSRDAKPVLAIVRSDRSIILPALGIGARTRILEAQCAREVASAREPEMKPLPKLSVRIPAY